MSASNLKFKQSPPLKGKQSCLCCSDLYLWGLRIEISEGKKPIMPDQLAHMIFAREAALRAGLSARLDLTSAAFCAGTFGPDPLFNDVSANIRAFGLGMHKRPAREAMERMREPILGGMPMAAEYAAGFFCHYALDRICHPTLIEMARRGEAKHIAVETAFDRLLYQQGAGHLRRRLMLGRAGLLAAVQMYPGVSPRRFQADVNIYLRLRRAMVLGGTPLATVAGLVAPKYRGVVPFSHPDAGTRAGMQRLEALMRENIDLAAEQLARFFSAVDGGAPFDAWLNADFSGNAGDEEVK